MQMNLFTKQKETHGPQTTNSWLPGETGGWERWIGTLGMTCTHCYIQNYQQGPTVQHKKLCPILCNNLKGERIKKK